ncbi:unnamed protein product [Lactuca saligna]|uniref:Uncharacterized protein n=1 Tax=Lactuca saligna TaxID=75948 RepID=A0AA35Y101_LACSI|nr:unnamed protein product [Lactuca saligna]CAI9294620.1 unnamed protein product [Lactuca saligna]
MENLGPKKRGERGIAAFKSKISPEKYKVKFDKNNIPDNGMPTQFSSWFGMKKQWNIESNDQEKYLMRKAVKLASNFKSFLVSNFVNQELNACLKYDFIKPDEWERFVAQKTTREVLVYGGLFKNVENSRTTRPRQQVDMIPSLHESSSASGGRLTEYPPIKFEENHIAYQHEINEHFQGGLVDMMLSMNPPQVHLNAPEPRA